MLAYFTIAYRDQEFWRYQSLEAFLEKVSSGYQGQTGFRKIINKLRNVVCSPDIIMSHYVFIRTHEKKQIRESLRQELLLRGNNDLWRQQIWVGGTENVKPLTSCFRKSIKENHKLEINRQSKKTERLSHFTPTLLTPSG